MAEAPPPHDRSGSPLLAGGRYRLAAKLGQGGMAVVYRAYDNETGGWVAVKILLATLADPVVRARFEAEARAMQRLEHRNVIRVLEVRTDDPLPFFVMELAESGTVHDWLEAHGPMPPRLACDVVIQVCKAVAVAHRAGIVHRDIKPKNVLVNRRGVCKLTDFGIAWIRDEASNTETGKALGTVGFVAPEQRANARDATVLSDVYSIGSTLYNLVTGKRASELFFSDQEASILDGVPEPLVPVVRQATRFKPHERYSSARRLAKALFQVRAELEPDPPDTPSLVLRESAFEADEEESWSEITDAFTFAGDPGTPDYLVERTPLTGADSGPRPQAGSPHPGWEIGVAGALPAAQDDRAPSSAADDDLGEAPFLTAATREEAKATPAPVEPKPEVAQVPAEPFDWPRLAAWTAGALGLLGIAAVLLLGATTVQRPRELAERAGAAWAVAAREEIGVLEDLEALGADRAPLQARYDGALEDARRGDLVPDEAEALQDALIQAQRGLKEPGPVSGLIGTSKRVSERLRRIRKAHDDWVRAVEVWRAASRTPHGALAVLVHLESAPPPDPSGQPGP